MPRGWPLPDEAAQAASDRLARLLRERIADSAERWIPFDAWMEAVLYTPGLGYYSGGAAKFGEAGDFVTAPAVSPLFAWTLARDVARVLQSCGDTILEFGPGDGRLCVELLFELDRLGQLPERYLLLERSGSLRARQAEALGVLPEALRSRVHWLETPPKDPLSGVILANEVADALPVRRFRRTQDSALELGVALGEHDRFRWAARPAGDLEERVEALEASLGRRLAPGYESEYHQQLPGWIGVLSDSLARGVCLVIDYGYPRDEYYHPQRHRGTLMCHYRHRAHDDPFLLPGLQDVTAFVDFTAMAEAALEVGLGVVGYTAQAHYLMGAGITGILQERMHDAGAELSLRLSQQAKTLMLPGEMGERFQVLGLARGCDVTLSGFSAYNRLERL
ncbi:MAG: SAM-dependent methyltransferase [Ectothiorhodospiraceae bacterium]|nr:SAM-dependent methyltransferase [Ectothiorhodospiraceae bacterium]